MATTSIDPWALRAAARRLDTAADIVLGALDTHLRALQFDAGAAGWAHAAAGGAVRAAVDRIVADARSWAHASRDTARALRTGAAGHDAAEADAAAAFG